MVERLTALGAAVNQVRSKSKILYKWKGGAIILMLQVGEDWDSAHAAAEESLAEGDFLVHPHAQVAGRDDDDEISTSTMLIMVTMLMIMITRRTLGRATLAW